MKTSMMLLSFCASGLLALTVWTRPYSTDLLRYLWWRITGPGLTCGRVRSGNASISYATTGTGKPLVLLHGGLSSSLDWYALVPALAKLFLVVLVDSRGHGSSTLGQRVIGYDILVEDVIAVLDDLALSQVDVAGWSDGGNAGLLMALQHPDRIRQLLAISANAHPDGLTADAVASIERISVQNPSLFSRLLYRWQSPEHTAQSRLRAEVTRMWKGGPLLTDEELKRIEAPTLLLIGENDDVALGHARKMAQLMRHSTLQVISDVGHNVPQAAAEKVLASMLRFFR